MLSSRRSVRNMVWAVLNMRHYTELETDDAKKIALWHKIGKPVKNPPTIKGFKLDKHGNLSPIKKKCAKFGLGGA